PLDTVSCYATFTSAMPPLIQAMVVDRNPQHRKALVQKLHLQNQGLSVLASLDLTRQNCALVQRYQPDLLFLDVGRPDLQGIEFLRTVENDLRSEVILMDQDDAYFTDCPRDQIIGFLEKPINNQALYQVLANWNYRRKIDRLGQKIDTLCQQIRQERAGAFVAPTVGGFELLSVENIVYCEAQNTYTLLHLRSGPNVLVTQCLKRVEERLASFPFVRIHKKYLVNLRCIRRYLKGDGGEIELQDGQVLTVSRSRKDNLLRSCHDYFAGNPS
ncbi:MAG: LytTR family DNA-binding domain-containing protein, partial [Bacteroidota bacterium]